jgi:hypothetical protein
MRELLRAVVTGKPIIVLLKTDVKHGGGLSIDDIKTQLVEAHDQRVSWGLASEVLSWGGALPTAEQLFEALEASAWIEWNRIGAFQEHVLDGSSRRSVPTALTCMRRFESLLSSVSLRLNAQRLVLDAVELLADKLSHPRPRGWRMRDGVHVYLQGELTRHVPVALSEPSAGARRIFCSARNMGAADLMKEVSDHFHDRLGIVVMASADQLPTCERMLVYLTARTYAATRAATS